MNEFTLPPTLAADCSVVGDFPLCRLLLMNNRHFPWVILVPRKNGMREPFDLSPAEQMQLALEINQTAQEISAMTGAYKMNVAALGNQVEQLHVHIVARFKQDAAWPNPVWNCGVKPTPYSDREKTEIIAMLLKLSNITKM